MGPWRQSHSAVGQGGESSSHPTGSHGPTAPGPPTSRATPRRCLTRFCPSVAVRLGPPCLASLLALGGQTGPPRARLHDPWPRRGRCPGRASRPPRLTVAGARPSALSPRPRAGTHRAGAARTPPARSSPRAAPWRGARSGSAARGREGGALMAQPRPWSAHPGRPGPAPRQRPGLPPPSSQPAGPPGRAVRLRGRAPPLWAGPRTTCPHWSSRRGLGARGRGPARLGPGPALRAMTATAAPAGQRQAPPALELASRSALHAGLGRVPRLATPALSDWWKAGGPGPAHGSPKPGRRRSPRASPPGAASLAIGGGSTQALLLGLPARGGLRPHLEAPSRWSETFNTCPLKKARCMSCREEQSLSREASGGPPACLEEGYTTTQAPS